MPKSLWDAQARRELIERLARLNPDAAPRWGRMSAPRMLAHLVDWMQMATGELETAAWNGPFRYSPLKQLAIYWLPFPKGVPTAPELIRREPSEWAHEHAEVCRQVALYETLDPKRIWPEHPAFGTLTPRAWGVLGYRHMDHHLRQFGS
jgi:hypothetical protein